MVELTMAKGAEVGTWAAPVMTVVPIGTMLELTTVERAGQLVTSGPQLVMVTAWVL
jgi:hypothetical protein